MSEDTPPRRGVFDSLRGICDSGLALLQNRLDLFSVELEEQKTRLVRVLLLAGVTILLANTAILVVTACIVVLADAGARKPVLIGLSVLYLVAAVLAFLALRKELRSAPPPFSGTLSEIKKDREWLTPQK
jgi:uncharacterized membrane protein YqjE